MKTDRENIKKEFIRFYNEVAQKYPETENEYNTLRGIFRKAFVTDKIKNVTGRFLDIGCGWRTYIDSVQAGFRVGVDIALPLLKKNAVQNRTEGDGVFFILGDAENLNFFKSGQFDFVLCSEVIEHVLHPEKVFEGIHNVLKEGGRFLVTTPNYRKKRPDWVDIHILRYFGIGGIIGDNYFHSAYRPEELIEMVQNAGLSVSEYGTFEKEIKYAAKLPVLLKIAGDYFNNHFFKSKKFEMMNFRIFDFFSKAVYKFCCFFHLNYFFLRFVKEGVRSYITGEKK